MSFLNILNFFLHRFFLIRSFTSIIMKIFQDLRETQVTAYLRKLHYFFENYIPADITKNQCGHGT